MPDANHSFAAGDVVKDRDGERLMTIVERRDDGALRCDWFETATPRSAYLHPKDLTMVLRHDEKLGVPKGFRP